MKTMSKEEIKKEAELLRRLGFKEIEEGTNEWTLEIATRNITIYFEDKITIPYTYEPNKYYVFDVNYSYEEPIDEAYDIRDVVKYF